MHERLRDEAVGRADEREGDDNYDLARGAGERKAAKSACGNAREQTGKAQLPNAQTQGVDFLDKALGDDDMAGIYKGREQHNERAGVEAGKVGARKQQHAAGDDGGADEHLALWGATQQGGVGKRHDHDRQALQKAGGGGRREAGAQAHAGELGCHDGADNGGADHQVAANAERALVEEQQAGGEGDEAAQRDDARGVHAVHADFHKGIRKAPCDGNGK